MSQYKGRIVGLSFFIVSILFIKMLEYVRDIGVMDTTLIQVAVISFITLVFWLLGKRYDKAVRNHLIDSLTQVYNRNYITKYSSKIFKRAKHKNEHICIMLIDIDNFKKVNDTYGHLKGDEILKFLANTIKMSVRETDSVIRWGGDEFVLFIYDVEETAEVCPMQNRLINNLNMLSDSTEFDISFSLGRSVFSVDGDNLDDLISVADKRMYHIKKEKVKKGLK